MLTKNAGHADAVAAACATAGLELDRLGPGVGTVVDDLPLKLRQYDVVFATARMALEAMACGCAVIVVDARGLAGLVTSADVEAWRRQNFGRRLLTRPVTSETIGVELARYDAADARTVSETIRRHANLADYLDRLTEIYRNVVDDFVKAPVDPRITLMQYAAASREVVAQGGPAQLTKLVQKNIDATTELTWLRQTLAATEQALAATEQALGVTREALAATEQALTALRYPVTATPGNLACARTGNDVERSIVQRLIGKAGSAARSLRQMRTARFRRP